MKITEIKEVLRLLELHGYVQNEFDKETFVKDWRRTYEDGTPYGYRITVSIVEAIDAADHGLFSHMVSQHNEMAKMGLEKLEDDLDKERGKLRARNRKR